MHSSIRFSFVALFTASLLILVTSPADAESVATIKDVAEVKVQAPTGPIDDIRGGQIILIIKNIMSKDLVISTLQPVYSIVPGNVTFAVGNPVGCVGVPSPRAREGFPCIVAPLHETVIPVAVSVHNLPRTGKTHIAFDLRFKYDSSSANLIATTEVTLGVFGESEVTPLLQIPSMLILPGALYLIVLLVLWRTGLRPARRGATDFPVSPSGLEFWLCALVASIALIALWRIAFHHNLLEGYGFRDIAKILGAAVALALTTALGFEVHKRLSARGDKSRTIGAGETALQALKKMAMWDDAASLQLPVVKVGDSNLLLYHEPRLDGMGVVGPPLVYDFSEAAPSTLNSEIDTLRDAGKIAPLARRLQDASKNGSVRIAWGSPSAPTAVKSDQYSQLGQEEPGIRWEDLGDRA